MLRLKIEYFLLGLYFSLIANPENPTVVAGAACFDGLNSSSLMIQATDGSIIHWDSFSIDAGQITQFIQPDSQSVLLNRVTGSSLSSLMGTLQANGKIYLVNPNGIIVGENGIIDAGSFIASSFDLSNSAFLG